MTNQIDDIKNIFFQWWQENQGTASFSILKKAKSLEDLILNIEAVKAYYKILNNLEQKNINTEKIFLILYILSHIKTNTNNKLGHNLTENNITELRMKKILSLDTNEDLFYNIRKIILQLKNDINVKEMVELLYFWQYNRTKKQLILDYYQHYKN